MSDAPHIENFEVVGRLGQGGMATVWKARQSSLDRMVAIKVLASSLAKDQADIARFRDEARAAGRLKHPGIVQVYDANFTNGTYYFVMELVDGYTVGEWIRRKGRLDESDALTVAESVIAALDYAWASFSIIHCDIKPENIMVDADGTVKTTDLGLARAIVSMQSDELDQEVLGTPAYMSPEQVTGHHDLDCRADIYALGATMYHMVTGHPLFAGEGTEDEVMQKQLAATVQSPSKEAPGLSHGFVLLLAKMLAKDRKYRPQDWKDVLADIRRVRERRSPGGHEPPPGSSTIYIDASESDEARRHAMHLASAYVSPSDGTDGGAWVLRLILWSLLLVVLCFCGWWFFLGGKQSQESAAVVAVAAQPEKSLAPPKSPAALADDTLAQVALAYVAANPADLTGGVARLEAVLNQTPNSWYAQQVRVQRDRLRVEIEAAVQAVCSRLETEVRNRLDHNRTEGALRLLENYHGAYAAETAAWRQEQVKMLRGKVVQPAPAPELAATQPGTPVQPQSRPHVAAITEEEAVLRVARALLKNNLDVACRNAADLAIDHNEWPANGCFKQLMTVLEQAHAAERATLETFGAERGRDIPVALTQGAVHGTVGEVADGVVHLTMANGADRAVSMDEMDSIECVKRLNRSGENSAGALLLKTAWAYRAHAVERARTLAASIPDPVGGMLVRVVAEKPQ